MRGRIGIAYISSDFSIAALDAADWRLAKEIATKSYWSGEAAPVGRQFNTRLLWSETALYVRFDANQNEPLIVSSKPDLKNKTHGLWSRDVCEIFITPNEGDQNRYFEFEVAPTGEWIDLSIHASPEGRETDWEYASGMTSAAKIETDKIVMAIKIEWKALGKTPKAGDIWLGNLCRCIGKDPTRGYLSWQPTNTQEPSFHVPLKFGEFAFVK